MGKPDFRRQKCKGPNWKTVIFLGKSGAIVPIFSGGIEAPLLHGITKDIISHIIPQIQSEFSELIQVSRFLVRVSRSTSRLWSSIDRSQQERPFSTDFIHYDPHL